VLHDSRTVRRPATAVAGLALVLAACGSGSAGPPTLPTLAPPGPAATGGSTAAVATTEGARPAPPGAGDPAPGFFGMPLDGGTLGAASVDGHPVVVNFWLTTCEPCIRELPALAQAAADHDDLVVIGVNFEEGAEAITAFLDGFSPRPAFPILVDAHGEMARAYQVAVFPTTFFIDADGVIQYRRVGEVRAEHLAVGLERIGVTAGG